MTGLNRRPRVLVVGGDPGGARAVAPVADLLQARGACVRLIASETTAAMLKWDGLSVPVESMPDDTALEMAKRIVSQFDPAVVLTGLGIAGCIERTFRHAAHLSGASAVSVLDYWGPYGERVGPRSTGEAPESRPDVVCALDEESRDGLIDAGLSASAIPITGSPALEEGNRRIVRLRRDRDRLRARWGIDPGERVFGFFSEPFHLAPDGRRSEAPRDFDSSGHARRGYTALSALKGVLYRLDAGAARLAQRCRVLVKPHPREYVPLLIEAVENAGGTWLTAAVVQGADARDVIAIADGVFGMTSVALLEAGLAGVPAVSVQPGLRESGSPDYCRAVSLGLAAEVYDWTAFDQVAYELLAGQWRALRSRPEHWPATDGAAAGVADVVLAQASRDVSWNATGHRKDGP